ncbi:hypothetical protein F511_10522 [Dorcoceras hygrometricum]|uniref:Delphilin-like n=1 Tax=Dorcoceras hygrometricum TaxID=472368 RepID=A0A2Z7AK65_9LAMI|nr:hypothetical protein F511_10522 [Dorcoceras hygrometricum]
MFRGNSDACISATVAILTITKTTLLTSSHLIVFKGNRSAYVSIADRGLHSLHSTMASAFITYSYQINFESVLMIHDHEGMLNMFKALEASGLRRFLGCESVLYETELGHFFDTALIQDEDITCVISGKFVSISPTLFTKVFDLPTEGITNFSEVPKDKVYDARSLFSQKGVQIDVHGKNKYMKHEFRLLNDILAKAITVKAGSFDSVTVERFQMMTAIQYGLKVNWGKVLFNVLKDMVDRSQKKAKGFAAQIDVLLKGQKAKGFAAQIGVLLKGIPAITMGDGVPFHCAKVLSMRTVHTYIVTNTTIDARTESEEPGMAKTPKAKKKPSSADEMTVDVFAELTASKKRSATEADAPIITKKRRTGKSLLNSSSSQSTVMASVFITYSYQINFESVLMIHDHEGMVNMFKALEASGLRRFLGCESVLYETELGHFFDTALIQDEDITCVISGKFVSISPTLFATVFDLPSEGITNFSEVPKDKVYDARSLFSQKGVQIDVHGKKKYMKHEFRLLNDILAKAITVKAGSFDSVTVECFQMMTAVQYGLKVNWGKVLFNVLKDMVDRSQKKAKGFAAQIGVLLKGIPAITMGDGVPFPSAKVLSMRTVHTYIVTNTTIDARTESEEPGMAKTPKAKKKPSSADEMPIDMFAEFTASKKRSATEADAPIITKKRRTGKSKPSVSQENLDIVQRRLVLSRESDDESVGTEEIIKKADAAVVMSTVEADIAKVLEETLELGVSATERESQGFDEALFEEDFARWLDDFVARHNEPELVSTNNEAQATGSINSVVDKEVNMPIDDLLIQISDDLLLPITTAEVTMIKLGAFSTSGDKGKENSSCWVRPVFLMNGVWTPVQGPEFWRSSCHLSLYLNKLQMPAPAIQEIFVPHISFIAPDQYWATVPWLMRIWRWTKVCEEVVAFNLSGGLRPVRKDACHAITVYNLGVERIPANFLRLFAQGLACNNFVDSVVKKDLGDTEEVVLTGVEEVDLISSDVSTVYRSPSPPSPGVDSLEHDLRFALGPAIFSRVEQDFLRSGAAKKGEVGSSSRPTAVRAQTKTLPPTTGTFEERVAQARRNIIETGQVISIEEAAERAIEADRRESERLERERRERRQSRSGTYKRRR